MSGHPKPTAIVQVDSFVVISVEWLRGQGSAPCLLRQMMLSKVWYASPGLLALHMCSEFLRAEFFEGGIGTIVQVRW